MKKREISFQLEKRLKEPRKFIQVLLGPRQVGKTTLVLQVAKALKKKTYYVSADLATLQDLTWLKTAVDNRKRYRQRKKERPADY